MYLRSNKALLKNFAIENLYVDVMQSHSLKVHLRNSIHDSRFEGFYLEMCRFLLKEAFYTHHDSMILRKMFCHFLAMLEVELAHQTTVDVVKVTAHVALLKHQFTFRVLNRNKNAFESVKLFMRHSTVSSR